MAVQNACQDELFQRVNFVTFTSSGTYTPPANLAYLHVLAVGAGAGRQRANGSSAADHVNAGNSGGGAQVGHALLTAAEVGASVNITVASAGISASPQSGPGGTTIVGVTTPLSAAGGQGLRRGQHLDAEGARLQHHAVAAHLGHDALDEGDHGSSNNGANTMS